MLADAGSPVPRFDLVKGRHAFRARRNDIRAARAEDAAGGRIGRARRIAGQQDARAPAHRIEARRRREQRPRVGMARRSSTLAAGPSSMIRPRYITTTRSQRLRTTGRSWLMNSSASPSRVRRSASSARTCAWTETSSAETGSSATMKSGSVASARAMPMRWRWPPVELVRIALRMLRLQADLREQFLHALATLPRRHQAVDREAVGDLSADPPARVEAGIGVLEDDLHAPPQPAQRRRVRLDRDRRRRRRCGRRSAGAGRAAGGRSCSCRSRSRRPARPPRAADRQVDVGDRLHGAPRLNRPRGGNHLLRPSARTSAVMLTSLQRMQRVSRPASRLFKRRRRGLAGRAAMRAARGEDAARRQRARRRHDAGDRHR